MLDFDYSSIYSMPKDKHDAGYKLDFAIYTTMTMDYTFWKKALGLQAGLGPKKEDKTAAILNALLAEELDHTLFICETDSSAAGRAMEPYDEISYLLKSIFYYETGSNIPCFHAKTVILRYIAKDSPAYYRFAVLSKNLTSGSDEEIGVVMDGIIEAGETSNGKRISGFLKHISENPSIMRQQGNDKYSKLIAISKEIRRLYFSQPEYEVYFGGIRDNDGNNKSLYQRIFPYECAEDTKFNIITKGMFVGEPFREWAGSRENFHIWNKWDGREDLYSDPTHVKAYLVERGANEPELWLGSANCSAEGLGKNTRESVECLVKVKLHNGCSKAILDEFIAHGYKDCGGKFPQSKSVNESDIYGRVLLSFARKINFYSDTSSYKDKENKEHYYRTIKHVPSIKTEVKIKGRNIANCCEFEGYYVLWIPAEQYDERTVKDRNWNITLSKMPFTSKNTPSDLLVLMLFEKDIADEHGFLSDFVLAKRFVPLSDSYVTENSNYDARKKIISEFLDKDWFEELTTAKDYAVVKNQAQKLFDAISRTIHNRSIIEKCGIVYSKICRLTDILDKNNITQGPSQNPYMHSNVSDGTNCCYRTLGLKAFQKRSAAHIVNKFRDGRQRMVLADEAGLGKTKVALGVIAEMALNHPDRSFNVYYACSNSRIREANVHRELFGGLERLGNDITVEEYDCDRLSMVPGAVKKNRSGQGEKTIKLYSFSTSLFDMEKEKYTGCQTERQYMAGELKNVCPEYMKHKSGLVDNTISEGDFAAIRKRFNAAAIQTIVPSLLILDEFHRFSGKIQDIVNLMPDSCKVLMLSATPYDIKPEDIDYNPIKIEGYEEDESPAAFESFKEFAEFLDKEKSQFICDLKNLHEKRLHILSNEPNTINWEAAAGSAKLLSEKLMEYMCRSERSSFLDSSVPQKIRPFSDDILSEELLPGCIEACIKAKNTGVSYSVFTPGIMSFALKYYNKSAETGVYQTGEKKGKLMTVEEKDRGRGQARYTSLFPVRKDIPGPSLFIIDSRSKEFIDLPQACENNLAMAQIMKKNVRGAERLLWVPAAKPYYRARKGGVFDKNAGYTKLFVFSNLKLIPRAVGSLISGCVDNANNYAAQQSPHITTIDELDEQCVKRLAGVFNPKDQCWAGMDCAAIVNHLCQNYGLTSEQAWYSVGSPQICAYRVLKEFYGERQKELENAYKNVMEKYRGNSGKLKKAREIYENKRLEYIEAPVTMALRILHAFNYYFTKREGVKTAVTAIIESGTPLIEYCADGNLDAVLEEMLHTLPDNNLCESIESVLTLKCTKVHLLYEGINMTKDSPVEKPCHFAERFTQDGNDENEHSEKTEAAVQDAFNSPFWPMILTSTSVAQEGLNFHVYCGRIMHYTLPTTPSAFEQRDGRIDRYHSHTLRRRAAIGKREESWEEIFKDLDNASGISPHWVIPTGGNDIYMERYFPVFPLSQDEHYLEKLLECRRVFRSVIGMPNELELMKNLYDIAQNIGRDIREIYPQLLP